MEKTPLSQKIDLDALFQKVKKKNQENIDHDLAVELAKQQSLSGIDSIGIDQKQQFQKQKNQKTPYNSQQSSFSYGTYGSQDQEEDQSDSSDDENEKSCIFNKIEYWQEEAYKYDRDEIPSDLKVESAHKRKKIFPPKQQYFPTQKKNKDGSKQQFFKTSFQVGGVYDSNNFVYLSQNLGSCFICKKPENRNILIRSIKPGPKYEIYVVCPEGCKGNIKKLQRCLIQELLDFPNIVKSFGKQCIAYLVTREY